MSVQTRFSLLDESSFLVERRIRSAIRPGLLLGFAPRAGGGGHGDLRLGLRAVVHLGQAQRTQFRFDILEGAQQHAE